MKKKILEVIKTNEQARKERIERRKQAGKRFLKEPIKEIKRQCLIMEVNRSAKEIINLGTTHFLFTIMIFSLLGMANTSSTHETYLDLQNPIKYVNCETGTDEQCLDQIKFNKELSENEERKKILEKYGLSTNFIKSAYDPKNEIVLHEVIQFDTKLLAENKGLTKSEIDSLVEIKKEDEEKTISNYDNLKLLIILFSLPCVLPLIGWGIMIINNLFNKEALIELKSKRESYENDLEREVLEQ